MTGQFKPEWRKRVAAACEACGETFMAVESERRRGKGRMCSLACAATKSVLGRDQNGERNPNWKGGEAPDHRRIQRAYRRRYPEKAAAHRELSYAIDKGWIVPQPCEACGAAPAEGHHDDYSRPLSVRWLCKPHHAAHHKAERNR